MCIRIRLELGMTDGRYWSLRSRHFKSFKALALDHLFSNRLRGYLSGLLASAADPWRAANIAKVTFISWPLWGNYVVFFVIEHFYSLLLPRQLKFGLWKVNFLLCFLVSYLLRERLRVPDGELRHLLLVVRPRTRVLVEGQRLTLSKPLLNFQICSHHLNLAIRLRSLRRALWVLLLSSYL